MMKHYESTWPGGFRGTLPKKVRTMAITKKHIQVESAKVYDTNLIYSRITGIQASGRDMNLNEVLKYELAPIPTSMFTNNGEMQLTTGKSALKNKLKVKATERYAPKATSVSIDGSAILWAVHWLVQGTVQYLVGNHPVSYVMGIMKDANVYFIFDKCEEYSIKGVTRTAWGKQASIHHQMSLSMHLPPQNVVLAVTYNTIQLVDVIVETRLA